MIKDLPRMNLHVHSTYSDGKDSISKIIEKFISLDLQYIAITDHFSNSWKKDIIPTLNSADKINRYLIELSEARNQIEQNKTDLRILKGIEIDLGSSLQYINRLITPSQFDVILFEYLETPESIGFVKNLLKGWKRNFAQEKLPILGLAHFDPSNFIYGTLDLLITFLKDSQIYFEFNSRYSQYYSVKYKPFFEKLRKHNIPVAVGADSHSVKRLDDISEPLEMIEYYDLKSNYSHFLENMEKRS